MRSPFARSPLCLTEPLAPPAPRPGADPRRDRGFVLAWMALMMVVLLGFAGFSVDLGHWYLTSSRVQNAADAAALGGVVFLPNELTTARSTAVRLAGGHGYAADQVTVTRGDRSNQLRVRITTEVDNFFVALFGLQRTRISRDAMAEFEGPVPMGSPESFLANDPETGRVPNYWMNVASIRNNARNGDRFHAGICENNGALGPCAAAPTTNPDYSSQGYFFAMDVTDTSGPLVVQVFDPGLYEVGDRCEQNQNGIFGAPANRGALAATLQAAALADPNIPDDWYDDALERYAPGNTGAARDWCTGDWVAGATRGGNGPITTTFIVREPDNTPWIDTDNPVASCDPVQFPGRDVTWMAQGGGIWGRLDPALGGSEWEVNPTPWRPTLANSFRRWVTVCTITNPVPGRYLLQVRTNAPDGQPLVADNSRDTWGHNRYSIRAGIGDPVTGGGVRVFANGRLPIYVNAPTGTAQFFLARVTPSATTRVLNVSLWDISDGGSAGTMRIVPPPDGTVNGWPLAFTDCAFGKTGGTWTVNSGNCSFSFTANSLDRHLVQIAVPLPDGYSCDEDDPFGCWIRVENQFTTAGASPNDTTTWSADIVGDPVRLVE